MARRIRQQPLFDVIDDVPTPTLYHAGDPATSREAVEAATANGTRARHSAIVFRAVELHPGLTAMELLAHTGGLREMQVRRRLTDLGNAGRVRQGDKRRCTVNGRNMVTWHAAGA